MKKTLKQLLAEVDEVCFKYSIQETTKRLMSKVRLSNTEYERLDKLETEAITRHMKRINDEKRST